MVPLLKYTVLRLALFVAALVLFTVIGAGQLVALVGAAMVSFLLSYLLLRHPREQLAQQIATSIDRRHLRGKTAAEEDAALEDAAAEDANLDGEANGKAADEAPAAEETGRER